MVNSFYVKIIQAIIFYNVFGWNKELLGDKKEFEKKEWGEVNLNQNIMPKKKKKQKKFY